MSKEHPNMHPKTYPDMNTEIVGLLRMADPADDPMSFYAAQRIEELEEQNAALLVALEPFAKYLPSDARIASKANHPIKITVRLKDIKAARAATI